MIVPMASLLLLLPVLLLSRRLPRTSTGRIYEGEVVTPSSDLTFPHHVQLGWAIDDTFCGGTLLSEK